MNSRFSTILLVLLFTSSCQREDPAPAAGVLGRTPVAAASVVDDHGEVLLEWLRDGRRNMTVVHLGEDGGLAPPDETALNRLRALARSGGRDAFPEAWGAGPAISPSYLAAAARLGVASRIYWVIPSRDLEFSNAELRIRQLLSSAVPGLSERDLRGMRLQGGCVAGELSGVDLAVCGVETLPALSGPVLVDIDAWFIPAFAGARGVSPLVGVKLLFEELRKRNMQVVSSSVVSSARSGDPLRVRARAIAQQLTDGMRDPSLIGPEPPLNWRAGDYVSAGLLVRGKAVEALDVLREPLKHRPDDPALRHLHAVALLMAGKHEQARAELARECGRGGFGCAGLEEGAAWLRGRGQYAAAEAFQREAERLRPAAPRGLPHAAGTPRGGR